MTSALSVMSLESQRLRYGKYSLWYSDNKIYLSDGETTNYLDVSNLSIIEWTPDTEGTYPAIPGGTEVTTLNHLLTAITTTLRKHEHKTDDISNLQLWFEEKKPELKGADGKDGKNGASAFEFWQMENYGNILTDTDGEEYYNRLGLYHSSIKGEKGDKGDTGEKGEKGERGEDGDAAKGWIWDLINTGLVAADFTATASAVATLQSEVVALQAEVTAMGAADTALDAFDEVGDAFDALQDAYNTANQTTILGKIGQLIQNACTWLKFHLANGYVRVPTIIAIVNA